MAGTVKDSAPYLIRIGLFDVDLALEGTVVLCRQQDRPGIIAAVSTLLAQDEINISFMSVARLEGGQVCDTDHQLCEGPWAGWQDYSALDLAGLLVSSGRARRMVLGLCCIQEIDQPPSWAWSSRSMISLTGFGKSTWLDPWTSIHGCWRPPCS